MTKSVLRLPLGVVLALTLCPHPSVNKLTGCEYPNVTTGMLEYRPCEPMVMDMAKLVDPVVEPANMTCGNTGSEFCTMDAPSTCEVCDARISGLAHPPKFMTDGEKGPQPITWWQSVSWLNYPSPLQVNITFSWQKTFEITQNIRIVFQSPRPYQMIIEKSLDYGATWQPWQYYARSCRDAFGMLPARASTISRRDITNVICTQLYSNTLPRKNGEVLLEVEDRFRLYLNGRKSGKNIDIELHQHKGLEKFVSLTDMRIRLLQPATNGVYSRTSATSNELMRYYYAISDIQIRGRCKCNLHASYCLRDTKTKKFYCDCKHNTEGSDCNKCKKNFVARQWASGSYYPLGTGSANECRTCECNTHSDRCRFIQVLGYVVCIGCYHNTMGRNCAECRPGYYRDATKEITAHDVCKACDCNPMGSRHDKCNATTGKCQCKDGADGMRCDMCVGAYYWTRDKGCQKAVCTFSEDNNCKNGGTCDNYERCICPEGYTGRLCERAIGMTSPRKNGGGNVATRKMPGHTCTLMAVLTVIFLNMIS
ncbi:netrin-G1-like [Branchiostoma floridae x Branchiostoma japonicum]